MSKKDYYIVEKNRDKIIKGSHTNFLDPSTINKVVAGLKGYDYKVYYPYNDCEKAVIYTKEKPIIKLLEITSFEKLTHREIMGSLYNQNIDSEMFGDIVIFDNHDGDNQKWMLVKVENDHNISDGKYFLNPKQYSDRVIDIRGGLVATGKLQTYQRKTTDAENQIFEIKYDSTDGFYNIINAETGSAFDIKGAGTANSTPVNVFPLHSNCNQDWLFEEDENGYYQIISRCSSRVLDAAPSGNIVIFDNHGGDNQKWMLVKANE